MIRRYCPHCWAKNPFEAKSCQQCGASLDESGKDFVSKLIGAIEHPEPTRAALAMDILGRQLRERRAVPSIMRRLARKNDSLDVAEGAARALGYIGERQAVPLLALVLRDAKRPLAVRLAAAEALADLGGLDAEEALERVAQQPRLPRLLRNLLTELTSGENVVGRGGSSTMLCDD